MMISTYQSGVLGENQNEWSICRTARRRVQFKIITVVKFGLIKMLLKDIKLICNNYILAEEAVRWSGSPDWEALVAQTVRCETKIGSIV